VLKVIGVEPGGAQQRRFRINENGKPASETSLKLVAFYVRRLLTENELDGGCRVVTEGMLALDLPPTDSVFFYDGLVFAALDAFNNPNKNPTITGLKPPER
jgi:hypothetical protein